MSKFDKFTMVDPLGRGDEEEVSMQEAVANEVNKRMGRAVDELKDKYDNGGRGFDAASDAQPTGAAYAQARAEQARRRAQTQADKEQAAVEEANRRAEEEELGRQLAAAAGVAEEEDSDEELLNGLDDDPELRRIREKRMQQLKSLHEERAENLSKGHGQFREIMQDEFLPEVTGSARVVVHFYHNDFERCKIMDARLQELAPRHVECKFVRINAEKAPFFVQKLQVRVLPTVICFIDGISVAQVVGFEGLTEGLAQDKLDEWKTPALARRLALAKVIHYTPEDAEGGLEERRKQVFAGAIREGGGLVGYGSDDEG